MSGPAKVALGYFAQSAFRNDMDLHGPCFVLDLPAQNVVHLNFPRFVAELREEPQIYGQFYRVPCEKEELWLVIEHWIDDPRFVDVMELMEDAATYVSTQMLIMNRK